MVMVFAVTAPVELAVPKAEAHFPTARSEELAVVRSVKVVDEVRVTTTGVLFLVAKSVSLTVTDEPFTAVTCPDAAPNPPAPARRGKDPCPERGRKPSPPLPPSGEPIPPGRAPPRPKPPPLNPVEHDPDTGWVIETVVAVTGWPRTDRVVLDDEVGLPNAEMHEPTVTLDADAATVWLNVVADV
jgi:hypothetical protein